MLRRLSIVSILTTLGMLATGTSASALGWPLGG